VTGTAAAPALRPRSALQLFDASLALLRRHAWDLFALSVLFHLPVHVFRIAGSFGGRDSALARIDPEQYLGGYWWTFWNAMAVSVAAIAAAQVFTDGATSVRRALDGLRATWWQVIGTIAAVGILAAGADLLIVAPTEPQPVLLLDSVVIIALIAGTVWIAPAVPAAYVEHLAPWTALRRALWLVRGNFWRTAVVVLTAWMLVSLADQQSVKLVDSLFHRPTVTRIVDLVVDGIIYAFRGVVVTVVYFDCRIRREAYDIERLMDAA
jgi:hypothetical protein